MTVPADPEAAAQAEGLRRQIAAWQAELDLWRRKATFAQSHGREDLAAGARAAQAQLHHRLHHAEQKLGSLQATPA
jgi:phage shock protein A